MKFNLKKEDYYNLFIFITAITLITLVLFKIV